MGYENTGAIISIANAIQRQTQQIGILTQQVSALTTAVETLNNNFCKYAKEQRERNE